MMKNREANDRRKCLIKDIRIYFNRYEAPYYDMKINSETGKCYNLEAKRKFTKYYLAHIGEFYQNVIHDNDFVLGKDSNLNLSLMPQTA